MELFTANYYQYTVLASQPPDFKMSMQEGGWIIFVCVLNKFPQSLYRHSVTLTVPSSSQAPT